MPRFFRQPIDDVLACLNRLADRPSPMLGLLMVLGSVVVTWFIYVPFHEMLHVAGCWVTGGTVHELQIAPEYGGAIFARFIPFVVSGGDYAGRLSGFDTHGHDLIYLATVFGPFVISVFPGVWLMQLCTRRPRPLLMGPAVVMALAPFTNLIGDYFEMGGIIVTRIATWLTGDGSAIAYEALRSDDVFKTVNMLASKPGELGIGPQSTSGAYVVVACSCMVALLMASATYWLGSVMGRFVTKQPIEPSTDRRDSR